MAHSVVSLSPCPWAHSAGVSRVTPAWLSNLQRQNPDDEQEELTRGSHDSCLTTSLDTLGGDIDIADQSGTTGGSSRGAAHSGPRASRLITSLDSGDKCDDEGLAPSGIADSSLVLAPSGVPDSSLGRLALSGRSGVTDASLGGVSFRSSTTMRTAPSAWTKTDIATSRHLHLESSKTGFGSISKDEEPSMHVAPHQRSSIRPPAMSMIQAVHWQHVGSRVSDLRGQRTARRRQWRLKQWMLRDRTKGRQGRRTVHSEAVPNLESILGHHRTSRFDISSYTMLSPHIHLGIRTSLKPALPVEACPSHTPPHPKPRGVGPTRNRSRTYFWHTLRGLPPPHPDKKGECVMSYHFEGAGHSVRGFRFREFWVEVFSV